MKSKFLIFVIVFVAIVVSTIAYTSYQYTEWVNVPGIEKTIRVKSDRKLKSGEQVVIGRIIKLQDGKVDSAWEVCGNPQFIFKDTLIVNDSWPKAIDGSEEPLNHSTREYRLAKAI